MTRPACMSAPEYELWQEANLRLPETGRRVKSPCADCTMTFALAMRAVDACDGSPAKGGRPPTSTGDPVRDAINRQRAAWAARRYRARKAAAAA